jgi:predicted MFS family arabinose efflux permease
MVANVTATDSRDRLLEPSTLALAAVQCVLVAGSLSFGVFPLLVDGLVRLAHFDVQSAGLSVTAEMLGQSIGAAGALAIVRRVGSRRVVIAALLFIIVGNGLTVGVYSSFRWLLVLRAVAGIGCGLTVVCIGLLAATKQADRNFAIFNTAYLVCCALLAAAVPALFRMLGVGGVFAVIAGATALCLWTIPLIPESHRERTQHRENASSATVPFVLCMLTCMVTVAYFVSATMFWSYAGNVGDVHHMGVATVSSAVALASLVGGLGGSIAAILVVKRLPRMFIIVVAAIGGAASTYAAIYVFNPVAFSIILLGFQFFWNLLYPIQMGLFSWADTSGRLAMLAWFVQLIACAIGPAVGGFVLHVSSYSVLALVCALGYLLFVCAAFVLVPVAKQNVNAATGGLTYDHKSGEMQVARAHDIRMSAQPGEHQRVGPTRTPEG